MESSAAASYSISVRSIEVGPLSLRVFQLPNAMYCLCLVDVMGIESSDGAVRKAIGSKIFRSLSCRDPFA